MHDSDVQMRRTGLVLTVLLALAGCYGDGAGPPAADMTDLRAALAAREISVNQTVGGDPGCAVAALYRDAVRLDMTFQRDGKIYSAYLFRWRNQAAYDAAATNFNQCLAAWQATTEMVPDVVSAGTWRAFGGTWSPDFKTALGDALAAAGP